MSIIKEYCNNKCFLLPKGRLIYNSKTYNHFSSTGEDMIMSLLKVAPSFHRAFNNIVPKDYQGSLTKELYLSINEVLVNKNVPLEKILKGKSLSLKEDINKMIINPNFKISYFKSVRQFGPLTPDSYVRTDSPRITTKGVTFHGMRKDFKTLILKKLTEEQDISFVDLDMSACHSRVAASLLKSFIKITFRGKFLGCPSRQ